MTQRAPSTCSLVARLYCFGCHEGSQASSTNLDCCVRCVNGHLVISGKAEDFDHRSQYILSRIENLMCYADLSSLLSFYCLSGALACILCMHCSHLFQHARTSSDSTEKQLRDCQTLVSEHLLTWLHSSLNRMCFWLLPQQGTA